MTANALKNIATGQVQAPEQKQTLAGMLAAPKFKAQLALAVPRHIDADRMARIALTELRKIPKLAECEPASFLGAVMQCAQLGLEPGGALGHVYLLPFEKRQKRGDRWETVGVEAQVIIGYRGMIELARRSGQIVSIEARAVYEGDQFDCVFGLDSKLHHVPAWENVGRTDAAALRFVYAVAKLKDGGVQFDVMSRVEVDAIRNRSRAGNSGPWVTDYSAMALKTVIRRLFKYLPVSIELQRAVALGEREEAGISQELSSFIDGETGEIIQAPEPTPTPTPANTEGAAA